MKVSLLPAVSFALLGFAAYDTLPEGDGRAVVERFCGSACHGVETVTASGKTPEKWKQVVDEMIALGAANPSEDESKALLSYLNRYFPLTVNVNKASARQISDILEITIRQAIALVQYREKHGPFSTWQDVAKVPELDATSIDEKKDRLVFSE